ncbi:hypothetical protein JCM19238_2291 [Vibrio ponticus]|nr:hypothetical protein JCM19238_2291 [Vibrio ponticus]
MNNISLCQFDIHLNRLGNTRQLVVEALLIWLVCFAIELDVPFQLALDHKFAKKKPSYLRIMAETNIQQL